MASPGTLKTKKLIVTCLDDHPKAAVLLRIAQRRAQDKGGTWRAVYIETPGDLKAGDEGGRNRMLRLLTLAKQMGGEVMHLEAPTVEKGVTALLEAEGDNIASLIVGSSTGENRLQSMRSPWKRIVNMAARYTAVEIVPLSGQHYGRLLRDRLRWREINFRHLAYALLTVTVAYFGALLLEWLLPPALFRINNQNVALLFMIACAFAAGRFGLLPGLVASVAALLMVNYYFTVPYHTLKLFGVTDALNMALFLGAAVLISIFTSQTRRYAERAAKRELSTQALFALYRIASTAFSRQQAVEKLQRQLTRMLEMEVAFFLPPALNPDRIDLAFPQDVKLEDNDRKALEVCWSEMRATGLASPYNPGTQWRFEPMIATGGEIGVLGVRPPSGAQLDVWFGQLLAAIADQTASALEHIELERSMEATRIREEREKLRAMLLSSVSHDLKTPLACIIGSLSVHRTLGAKLSESKREELIETAMEEAQRLDSFITNILDMTRLESGKIEFKQDWHEMGNIIQQVGRRLQHRLKRHTLVVHAHPRDIEVYMDATTIEQVLQNLVDNACKYTPPGTRIEIRCVAQQGGGFQCEVRDHGEGLPSDRLERVFDKYARLQKEDSQIAGTGLGLAVCKAVIEAQKGWIRAANHPEGGAAFTFSLPLWREVKPTRHVA